MAEYDLITHVTRFCRVLRDYGLLVGPQEAADAIRAVGAVELMERGRVYWTLRAVLVSRRDELPVFDELFERLWTFEPMPTRPPGRRGDGRPGPRDLRRRPGASHIYEHDAESDHPLVQILRDGASPRAVASTPDLTGLSADALGDLSRIAARMVRALASRPGRRRRRHPRKGVPDLRGALRLSLTTGGEPVRLPRMRRVPRVPRLLVLVDVSGSMDRHAALLLQLVYAVAQQTRRMETFVFSTSVTRVTRELRLPSFSEARRRIGQAVDHWSGGTRIGESLSRINEMSNGLLDRHTTVLLLSDGWDTGEPQDLAREVRRVRRRARSLVWLNPLLGGVDYEPLTRGLLAAAPHVDHFVPAGTVDALKRLPYLLRG